VVRFLPLLALGSLSCGTSLPFVWVDALPGDNSEPVIQTGDEITVLVKDQKDLTGAFPVLPDGAYVQPIVGPVRVAGLTVADAAKRIATLLDGIVVKPLVAVSITNPRPINISIIGEIARPGKYPVRRGEGVLEVLAAAGGINEFASDDGIFVLRKYPDRQRIRFRYSRLAGGDLKSVTFELRDGDIIVVE
jgi:polysaccharide export outer membrane protein